MTTPSERVPASADLPTPFAGGDGRCEAWCFDAVSDDAALGVAVCVGRNGTTGRGWYWAAVAGEGRTTVVVADPDLALPTSGPPLELRAPGLWADHNATAAGGHWSVACEAFGVALEDPWAAWGRAYGDPTPVGLDLEWDPVTPPVVLDGDLHGAAGWWSVGCEVHGEVLVGSERFELASRGSRSRWWGSGARPARGEWEATGWTSSGWSHRTGRVPPAADVRGEGRDRDLPAGVVSGAPPLAWAPVRDGAEVTDAVDDGAGLTGGRLAMAVVRASDVPESATGWVRWRPGGQSAPSSAARSASLR